MAGVPRLCVILRLIADTIMFAVASILKTGSLKVLTSIIHPRAMHTSSSPPLISITGVNSKLTAFTTVLMKRSIRIALDRTAYLRRRCYQRQILRRCSSSLATRAWHRANLPRNTEPLITGTVTKPRESYGFIASENVLIAPSGSILFPISGGVVGQPKSLSNSTRCSHSP